MSTETTPLAGRHALVTGAGRGIGRAIATRLAADGAQVTLVGRDGTRLDGLAVQLGGPSKAHPAPADITDERAVEAAFTAARARFGPVHILVNNAGRAASAKFTDTEPALWNAVVGVNLTGTYLCTRQAIPDMLAQGFGRIVNIASTAGLRGGPYLSAYVASKHAVVGLTRALAQEYATRNITVNAVCPGYTDTDMVRDAVMNITHMTGRGENEALQALLATNPQQRLITPEEIAHTTSWLCGPGTESLTGQCIVIAGGEAA